MKEIKSYLESRKERNKELISKANEEIKKNDARGRLSIIKRGKSVQYRKFDDTGISSYLSDSDEETLKALAQKRYLQKVIIAADRENSWIDTTIKNMPDSLIEDIYKDNPNRRALITPYFETDEEYIKRWLAKPYVKKGFNEGDPEFWTEKGERVRSKSEQLIANKLYKLGIPYIYEYPIRLHNGWVVYPDFKILDVANRKDIIHEHFGRMDDPEYVRKNMIKINEYAKSGLFIGDRMIATFESKEKPFSDKLFESQLKAMGLIRE